MSRRGLRAISWLGLAALAVGCHSGASSGQVVPDAGAPPEASSPTPVGFLAGGTAPPAPWRRLTRAEYRGLVREVFGLEPPTADELPDDSRATGFTSTANQLMTIAATDRYLDAAIETGERLEPTIRALMPCDAPDGAGETACIDRWLREFGPRLFRRPMTDEERGRYVSAFARTRAKDTYERSASLVVQALLVAPEVLFVELPSGDAAGTRRPLDGWQLASRLALLLWDSLPDEPLRAAAARGELGSRAALAAQVDRMLRDPRARAVVREFFDDWLSLGDIEGVGTDIDVYPFVPRDVAADLAEETRAHVADAFWEQDDFRKLFVSKWRFRSPRLSAYYDDTLSTSGGVARYEGEISESSFGLLSQRGFLMMLSKSDENAPIRRGAFLRRKLLCGRLPPPPPGLATPLPPATPGASKRERITAHTSGDNCVGCHGTFNPLGFALERFDIGGKFRDEDDDGLPIDAHVTFDEPGFEADVDGARALSEALANSATARACLTKELFTFALEREPTLADQPLFDRLMRTFEASGFSMKTVLVELILSDEFRSRTEPGALP